MKVVAEGVEKKEQAAFLQNMNCDQIQGYYYSSPKSYEVFDKMIRYQGQKLHSKGAIRGYQLGAKYLLIQ